MRGRLGHLDRTGNPWFFHFNPHLRRVANQHLTLVDFLRLPQAKAGYRIAAFVQNPYDRVVFGFKQLIRNIQWQPNAPFPEDWMREMVIGQLTKNAGVLIAEQYDVNRWFQRIPAETILDTGRDLSLPLHPVHYWTHLDGEKVVDFIGTIENFEPDFARLCAEFGISDICDSSQLDDMAEVPDANGYRYSEELWPETIARINRLFAADFALLDYRKLE